MELVELYSRIFVKSLEQMECPYFQGRASRTEFLFQLGSDPDVYEELLADGYRRTGGAYYRNRCFPCSECVPIRIRAEKFRPSKGQRRNLKRNSDIRVEIAPSVLTPEKMEMYGRYVRAFHAEGTEDPERDLRIEMESIQQGFPGTVEMDLYLDGKLAGVSVLDICRNSISADYFYHDPDHRDRGLGVFSILKDIEHCRSLKKEFYYLGYYIAGCGKMSYKSSYRPYELLLDGVWTQVEEKGFTSPPGSE